MNVLRTMLLVGGHAFGRALRSRRTWFLVLLCALPLLINVVALQTSGLDPADTGSTGRGASRPGFEHWVGVVLFGYFHVVAGFGALFLGPAVLGDEVEGRTITYVFTRPIRREAFFVARLLGYVVAYSILIASAMTTPPLPHRDSITRFQPAVNWKVPSAFHWLPPVRWSS